MTFILGKKVKMTQIWKDQTATPVTVVSVPENKVSLIRRQDRDKYEAVQLSLGKTKREFCVPAGTLIEGATLDASSFKEGDRVRVSGASKGRGFQGVVKRHGFHGGPKTHGQKNRLRAPGSIGSTAPQRVWPGRRMAGRMGGERITVKNLVIVAIEPEKNLLFIKGAIPGAPGSILEIQTLS